MAARKRKIKLDDVWREKIRISHILNRLIGCFNGEIELNRSQLKAAEIILKKVVPDLKSTELKGRVTVSHDEFIESLRNEKTGNEQ